MCSSDNIQTNPQKQTQTISIRCHAGVILHRLLVSCDWQDDDEALLSAKEHNERCSTRLARGSRSKNGVASSVHKRVGGRCLMEFNSGVIPPSACASRLSMFSRTTEAAFSTVMLILPATPAHDHRTACRPTLIHATFCLLRRRILKSHRKTATVSCDVEVATVVHVKLRSQTQAETDVTRLTPGRR